jgi:hypothetical protein
LQAVSCKVTRAAHVTCLQALVCITGSQNQCLARCQPDFHPLINLVDTAPGCCSLQGAASTCSSIWQTAVLLQQQRPGGVRDTPPHHWLLCSSAMTGVIQTSPTTSKDGHQGQLGACLPIHWPGSIEQVACCRLGVCMCDPSHPVNQSHITPGSCCHMWCPVWATSGTQLVQASWVSARVSTID